MFTSALSKTAIAATVLVAVSAVAANAGDIVTYNISVKNNVFTPSEITVKAGEAFRIKLSNKNATPVELESAKLGFEKVAAGMSDILINVRPQKAGTYKFVDDFHPKDAVGQVVVK